MPKTNVITVVINLKDSIMSSSLLSHSLHLVLVNVLKALMNEKLVIVCLNLSKFVISDLLKMPELF